MNYKIYILFFPFFSFLFGYQIFSYFFIADSVQTPVLVGKSLPIALQMLSERNLNVRLLAQKSDEDLPEGTILSQIPEAGTQIKPRQNVFLVTSKKPPVLKAPDFIGLLEKDCIEKAKSVGVRLKIFPVVSDYPSGRCIAQNPSMEQELDGKIMIIYISQADSSLVIFPNLVGLTYEEAFEFLHKHNFSFQLYHTNRSQLEDIDKKALVIDQKPRGGSLIDRFDKRDPIFLYFQV